MHNFLYFVESSSVLSLFSRFEEVDDSVEAGKKRPRDSDAMEADVSMTSTSAKKANKKLKGESGSAVPVNTGSESKANGEANESGKEKEKKKRDRKKKKGEGKSDAEGPSEGESKAQKPSGTMKELGGGLKIKDVKVGTGKQAKAGNTVSLRCVHPESFIAIYTNFCSRYIGKLPNGSKFDANTKGKPVSSLVLSSFSELIYCFSSRSGWARVR